MKSPRQNKWHCFRMTVKNCPYWPARPSGCSWTKLNCAVHVNGARAGWDCMCGISWNWTHFGEDVCRQAVRGQACPRGNGGWLNILKALTCYRLIDPGSEFRFHREWYLRSAIGDLPGEDYSLAQKDKPYRCFRMDLLLKHRDGLFGFLKGQWGNLFGAKYDVLLPHFHEDKFMI